MAKQGSMKQIMDAVSDAIDNDNEAAPYYGASKGQTPDSVLSHDDPRGDGVMGSGYSGATPRNENSIGPATGADKTMTYDEDAIQDMKTKRGIFDPKYDNLPSIHLQRHNQLMGRDNDDDGENDDGYNGGGSSGRGYPQYMNDERMTDQDGSSGKGGRFGK